jgi:penicillin-binding protein 1A
VESRPKPTPSAPKRKPRPNPRRWPFVLGGVALIFAALAGAVAARGPFFFMSCDPDDLGPSRLDRTTYVYSADGELLTTLGSGGEQRPVRLERISPWLRGATIAIEDRRFYEHGGVDFFAVFRALFRDVAAGGVVEGGSTITQQLVRNLYLGREQTLGRKLREGCLAVALEREWSKQRVLETYLNTAYYGNGAYGAEAAARTYFGVSARRLSLQQAALLAGLPKAPSQLDPFTNEDAARDRREEVLRALVETGRASEAGAREAASAPLGVREVAAARGQDRSIANLVVDELTTRYGAGVVRQGGLKVHTTIRARLQREARRAISATLGQKRDPAAAVVAVDPATGAIRAVTSFAAGRAQFFNLAAYGRRQTGSAFKPFVLTQAVRREINPWATTYLSAPFEGPPTGGKPWLVETYDGTYTGRTTIADATLRSDNTAYARLTLDVGPEKVVELAHAMGIESELPEVPSVGLGVASVAPLELASAYATLAAGGVHRRPFLIRKVVFPNDQVDGEQEWGPRKRERVLPEPVAFEVTRILEQNIEAGTGTGAQIDRPAAGKTGTTDDFADAWFAGYTPQLAAVVWVGYPRGRIPMLDVHGIAVAGGTFPATIWQGFMSAAVANLPVADWREPEGSVDWHRFCGRFQYARTFRDARPEAVCPKPKPKPSTPTVTVTTPPPPPPTSAPQATVTQPPPAPPPDDDLVGAKGTVTQDVDNELGTGEVEVRRELWPARSETGEPIPAGTRITVVRRDGEFLYVVPT